MASLRVAVVGARRAHQGLGPFVARDLRAAGAEVVALLTTNESSGAEAAGQCARIAGAQPRAYVDIETLLAAERPQALAICSPHATHAQYLERALDSHVHVLCEKPLVWGDDFAARTARTVQRFAERGLVLIENCQWPYTLPAFAALHPGALDAPPHLFGMLLQPVARGRGMLADSLPHPLSLLQCLAPAAAPRVEDLRIVTDGADRAALRFRYATPDAQVGVAIDLHRSDDHPHRFRLEIDGLVAERQVRAGDYVLRLAAEDRSVPLPDPMSALIADFVACASAGIDPRAAARRDEITARAALLEVLAHAWPTQPRS
ncbi:MAG: Gfo/Idh/MocA family oxidoreductase [Deltaproteobacteria bacterium]|nr:Gfo/Idh/MocA family oxidoreductase [Deltaproteobacteria bacterium]